MINKKTFLTSILIVLRFLSIGQTDYNSTIPINYVRIYEPTAPFSSEIAVSAPSRIVEEVKRTTQFVDGLGRAIQTVSWQASPTKKDLVQSQYYDEFGKEIYKFMPYVSSIGNTNDGNLKYNAFSNQLLFNSIQFSSQNETSFYTKTNFENSLFGRPIKTMPQGVNWVGNNKGVEKQYSLNTSLDEVRVWDIGYAVDGTPPLSTTTYPEGALYKSTIIDEHGKKVIEYNDKEGKIILKKAQIASTVSEGHSGWYSTYYVYDDFGNLRYVISPKAVEYLIAASWNFANTLNGGITLRDELCFYYLYDNKNRVVIKKVPGAGEVHMVYDERDRLVMTQDAVLRQNQKWFVTLYDNLNRPFKTGLWNNNNSRSYHQNLASQQTGTVAYPGEPTTGWDILSEMGYDSYSNLPAASGLSASLDNTNYNNINFVTTYNSAPDYAQQIVTTSLTEGMQTWIKTKVLDNTNPATYLYSLSLFDDKGKVVQVKSTNITGGIDVVTTQYDFSGKTIRNHLSHQKTGGNPNIYLVSTKPSFDHAGRLLNISKNISAIGISGGNKIIVQNTYNELGQVKTKKLAPEYNGGNGLESLEYDYNIRGWLLGVNRNYVKDANSTNYFGFDLGYDKTANGLIGNASYNNAQYNGNISGMVWKSKGDGEKRRYDFAYDATNRLLKADFTQYTGGAFNQTAGINFDVKMGDGSLLPDGTLDPTKAYDANGNILQMQQWGLKINTSSQIDNLRYTYFSGSNRLKSVTDFNNETTTKLGDFKTNTTHPQSGTKTGLTPGSSQSQFDAITDYNYDLNGNLNLDNNKTISGITYNHLNLPSEITITGKGNITYTYDAGGNKIKKQTVENPTTANDNKTITTTITYVAGMVYESKTTVPANTPNDDYSDKLQFAGQEEGRIRALYDNAAASNTLTGFVYDYMLKDHLGNVRMVLTEELKQVYYPASTLEGSTTTGALSMINYERLFYSIDNTKIVAEPWTNNSFDYDNNNGIANPYPAGYTTNTSSTSTKVYKLNATTNTDVNKTGLGIVLKVMAGDNIDIFGKSFHKKPSGGGYSGTTNNIIVSELIDAFVGSSIISGKGVTGAQITGQSGFPTTVGGLVGNQPAQDANRPKAAVNWIVLDEQFKWVSGGFDMVGNAADNGVNNTITNVDGTLKTHNPGTIPTINIPKNGYLYVWASNESKFDVFFDNLQLVHSKGRILEETHYYPFGLTMTGISSKSAGGIENKKNKFQNQEFNDDLGVNYYEFKWRNHDPQIGRFIEIDPLAEKYVYNSTYAFSENHITSHVELEGLEKISIAALFQNDENNKYPVAGMVDVQYDFNKNSIRVLTGVVGDKATSYEYNITNKTIDVQTIENLTSDQVGAYYYKPTSGKLKPDLQQYTKTIDQMTLGLTDFAGELNDKLKSGNEEMSKALGVDVNFSTMLKNIATKMKDSKAWNMSIFYSNDEGKDVPDGKGGTKPELYTGEMSVGFWRKDVPLFTGTNGNLVSAILLFQYQDQTKKEPAKK
jgi:RHS repeat-associated protein